MTKPISSATQDDLDMKAPLLNPTFSGTIVGASKETANLANVDNTSGLNQSISNATQTALSDLIDYRQTMHYNRDQIHGIVADFLNCYTKEESYSSLALKANQATTYTKTEVDSSLALKANQTTTYTKTEVENNLVLQSNQTNIYQNRN